MPADQHTACQSSLSETIPETQATAALACGGRFAFTSVAATQCSSTFSAAGLHLTLGTADIGDLECTSDSNWKFAKSTFELRVLPGRKCFCLACIGSMHSCPYFCLAIARADARQQDYVAGMENTSCAVSPAIAAYKWTHPFARGNRSQSCQAEGEEEEARASNRRMLTKRMM